MKQLNRNKDFGTIHGAVANNARFVQNGYEYDVNGNLLEKDGKQPEELIADVARKEAEELAAKAAEAQKLLDSLNAQKAEVEKDITAGSQEGGVELNGTVYTRDDIINSHHMTVKKMVAAKGGEFTTKEAAADFLLG